MVVLLPLNIDYKSSISYHCWGGVVEQLHFVTDLQNRGELSSGCKTRDIFKTGTKANSLVSVAQRYERQKPSSLVMTCLIVLTLLRITVIGQNTGKIVHKVSTFQRLREITQKFIFFNFRNYLNLFTINLSFCIKLLVSTIYSLTI